MILAVSCLPDGHLSWSCCRKWVVDSIQLPGAFAGEGHRNELGGFPTHMCIMGSFQPAAPWMREWDVSEQVV